MRKHKVGLGLAMYYYTGNFLNSGIIFPLFPLYWEVLDNTCLVFFPCFPTLDTSDGENDICSSVRNMHQFQDSQTSCGVQALTNNVSVTLDYLDCLFLIKKSNVLCWSFSSNYPLHHKRLKKEVYYSKAEDPLWGWKKIFKPKRIKTKAWIHLTALFSHDFTACLSVMEMK